MAWHNDQVSEKETKEILKLAQEQISCEGDFVEMGCYRGDTSLLLAEVVQRDAMLLQRMRCSVDARLSASPSAAPASLPSIHAETTSDAYSSFSIHDKSVSDGYSAAPASSPSIHAETTSNTPSSFSIHDKGVSDGYSAAPASLPSIHAETTSDAHSSFCDDKSVSDESSVASLPSIHAETTSGALPSKVSDDGQEKRLWIYDSFEGLPEKSGADESAAGRDFKGGELAVTKREVKERFLRAGLKVPVIKKAWFSELTEVDLPEKIAFAFLDGDFYESIRDSLKLVWGKMASGGVVVVHDYMNPALPGVAKAVDEWCAAKGVTGSVIQSMFVVRM